MPRDTVPLIAAPAEPTTTRKRVRKRDQKSTRRSLSWWDQMQEIGEILLTTDCMTLRQAFEYKVYGRKRQRGERRDPNKVRSLYDAYHRITKGLSLERFEQDGQLGPSLVQEEFVKIAALMRAYEEERRGKHRRKV